MSVTAEELDQYVDQRIILTRNLKEPDAEGNGTVEIEGTCMAANSMGVMIKPKGKVNADIVELGDIEEIRFAPAKITPLKQKPLIPVVYGQARKHLADRHAFSLKRINELSEEDALKEHSAIDHSDLGHKHEAKAEEKSESDDE